MSARSPQTHLLVVTTNYAETHGGVEMHLASLLPRLVERGSEVSVIYLGSRRQPWTEASGVRVVPLARHLDFREIMAIPSARQWHRFSNEVGSGSLGPVPLTHVATHTRFFPLSWLGVRLARRLRIPSVHTEHGGGFVVTSSSAVETCAKGVDLTLGRAVLRGATSVLGVSAATCSFVKQLSGVDAIPFGNGIDLATWLPTSTPHSLAPDERRLVFVGRVVAEKGWRTFLDIAAACQSLGWRGETWLIGQGGDLNAAKAYAAELGLERFVAPGQLPSEQVRDSLRGAVYVNPSLAAEGFQLTQVEALASGAAVATYNVGVAPELVRVPQAAITVVPVGDAVALDAAAQRLLVAPAPRPTFGQLAAWDWGHLADEYVAILERVKVRSA